MMLTKQDRNKIYDAIAGTGLDPAQCELDVKNGGFRIIHNSGSWFTADLTNYGLTDRITAKLSLNKRRFDVVYQVVDGNLSRRLIRISLDNLIDALLPFIVDWATDVKRISELPDRWADIKRSETLIADIQGSQEGAENTPFTQDEQKQITAQLQAIKEHVKEQFDLTGEQIALVEERLDEAADAAERMGRKDWLLLFGGTIFNLIVTDTVTPSVAGHIFTTVVHGLIHLFTGGPPQILA